MKIARIYGRFSSKPQERGDSKRRQIEGARAYAAKEGYTVVAEYFDEAVSGKDGLNLEREFGRLIHEASSGDTIFVEILDRIGRQNPFVLGKLIYDLISKGLTIITWTDRKTIDATTINTLETQFSVFTGSAVGHQENVRKIGRIREVTNQSLKDGVEGIQSPTLVKFLPQCFEWDILKKQIVLNEDKAAVIRRIFDEFNNGVGRTSICQRLNKDGIPTPYKSGKQTIGTKRWMETSITKILKNESYAGVLHVKNYSIQCIPVVIDKETFQKTQMLIHRHQNRKGKLSGRINNLFPNIAKCVCGASMKVNICPQRNGSKYYMFRCEGAKLGVCEHKRMMNATTVELIFFSEYLGGSPENLLSKESKELKERLKTVESLITKTNTAIDNLYNLVEEGDKGATERLKKRQDELANFEQEKVIIQGTLASEAELPTAIEKLDELFGTPEGDTMLKNWYITLGNKLVDFDFRRKVAAVLPNIFSELRIHPAERTIQGIKRDGTELRKINIDTFERP